MTDPFEFLDNEDRATDYFLQQQRERREQREREEQPVIRKVYDPAQKRQLSDADRAEVQAMINAAISEALDVIAEELGAATAAAFKDLRDEIKVLREKWLSIEAKHAVQSQANTDRLERLLNDLETRLERSSANVLSMVRN
jgi:hypothetical protein